MRTTLRVLHIEDQERDVALIARHLSRAGYEIVPDRVDMPAAMKAALETREWDVILCDYSMPHFSALQALELMKTMKRDIPFIIISGTIGEAAAVEAMRAGAHDYLMKDSLARLAPAIERELTEAENRRARRQAEEQLRLQSAAVQAAANAIIITNRNGKIIWVNPAFAQHTGYSLEEVQGKTPRVLKSGKHNRAFYEEMWETILSGQVWHNTIINREKGGKLKHEDLTITPIPDASGAITHFVGIKQDITERMQAEQSLRESEERLQTIIENLDEGLVISELGGQLVHWNRSALDIHGFVTMDECLLRLPEFETIFELTTNDGELVPPDEWPLARIIRGEQLKNLELRVRRLDRQNWERFFNFGGEIVKEPSGKLLAFVTMTDITERKNSQEALRRAGEELAAATQQLWQASKLATMGELAASVAHELNNPLATIGLRAELMVEQLSQSESARDSAQIVLHEVERMAELVNNLLQFSRRSYRQISTINVSDEISSSVNFIAYYLRNRNVTVKSDYGAGVPPIQADRQQLRQLFLNLLTNAADAMPDGGTLITRTAATQIGDAKAALIEFIDTGIGIPPENLDRIWGSFFTTKPEGKGTGLGLAICRRIVEEHGGTIEIESQIGQGATVRVSIPAASNGNYTHDYE